MRTDGNCVGPDGDGWSRMEGMEGMMMTWHDYDAHHCAWDESARELALISSSSLRSKHDAWQT